MNKHGTIVTAGVILTEGMLSACLAGKREHEAQ